MAGLFLQYPPASGPQSQQAVQSSGINYVSNGDFETNIDGWALYYDTPAATPVNGAGTYGTNTLVLARNTTSPLYGSADMTISKPASNCRGMGVAIPLTVDLGALGAALQLEFSSKAISSGYTDGDISVFLYDVTNSAFIPLSQNIVSASGGVFLATFFPSSSTAYRLIFHVTSSTNVSAFTLEIDHVVVAPQTTISGPVVSDEIAYTPTFQGFGTPTNVNFKWRRVGNKIHIRGTFTSGTSTAAEAQIGLPAGYTTPTDLPTISTAGSVEVSYSSAVHLSVLVEQSKSYLTMGIQSAGNAGLTKVNGSNVAASGQSVSFFAEVPIAQWSVSTTYLGLNEPFCLSNTESVANTNGVVGKTYNGWDGSPIVANTAATYYDMALPRALLPNEVPILELYAKATGVWTPLGQAGCPSLGVVLSAHTQASASGSGSLGNYPAWIEHLSSGQIRVKFAELVSQLSRPTGGWGSSGGTVAWSALIAAADGFIRWRVRIGKSAGTAEIAPVVSCITSESATAAASGPLVWSSVSEDTHNCLSLTTGIYTVAVSGLYMVGGTRYTSGTADSGASIDLYKNGVVVGSIALDRGGSAIKLGGPIPVRCVRGDTLEVRHSTAGIRSYSVSRTQFTRIGS